MAHLETHNFGKISVHEVGGMFVFGDAACSLDVEQKQGLINDSQVAVNGVIAIIESLDANSQPHTAL